MMPHLPTYLNEFVFRFNRRHSRSRGRVFYRVLELAVAHDPVRYGEIIAGGRAPGSIAHAGAATREAVESRPPAPRSDLGGVGPLR